ncbi:hypothetical protein RI367_008809 [Sorochytrium milnesiophthora]
MFEYKPNAFVPDHAYDRLLAVPTDTEFLRSMSNWAPSKATGPSAIQLGLLRQMGPMCMFFLWCLTVPVIRSGRISRNWRRCRNFCKPKHAAGFSSDVRKLRPISLLETMLKAVMTIVTSRLSAAKQKHGILRGHNNSVCNPVDFVNEAARFGNVAALALHYDHVDETSLRAATPADIALRYKRLETLRWLHTSVGIPCSRGCIIPPTARRLPCDGFDQTVAYNLNPSVELLEWLREVHAHDSLDDIAAFAASDGRQDLLDWIGRHATGDSWMARALEAAVRYGPLDMATRLADARPDLLGQFSTDT